MKETKKGWVSGGIKWREKAISASVHPDKFLEIPQAKEMIAKSLNLPEQAQVEFWNIVFRKYPQLRYK